MRFAGGRARVVAPARVRTIFLFSLSKPGCLRAASVCSAEVLLICSLLRESALWGFLGPVVFRAVPGGMIGTGVSCASPDDRFLIGFSPSTQGSASSTPSELGFSNSRPRAAPYRRSRYEPHPRGVLRTPRPHPRSFPVCKAWHLALLGQPPRNPGHRRTGGSRNTMSQFRPTYDRVFSKNKLPDYCLLYTSPSPRDATLSRMPSSA